MWESPFEAVGKCNVLKGPAASVVIVDLKDSCPSWMGLGMAAGISGLSHFGTSAFNWAVSPSISVALALLPGQVVTARSWSPVALASLFSLASQS